MKKVLVIGGYGNFGFYISHALSREPDIQVIIAGRDLKKAEACCQRLQAQAAHHAIQHQSMHHQAIPYRLDIQEPLAPVLADLKPDVVIHTSGPFQGQSYQVAQACIDQGCHYVDLADGRDFVCGITGLDDQARAAGVMVCSGASSVPGLSSALIEHYQQDFHELQSVDYGISTAHKTSRGLATTQAVLSYAGKPFTTLINGQTQSVIGWRDTRSMPFWQLGSRLLSNCDIPDLALFPDYFPSLKNMRFQAGLELPLIHGTLAALAWMVQHRLCPNLRHFARPMLTLSNGFNAFGTEDSGFFMALSGLTTEGKTQTIRFDLVARQGEGLNIPTIAAIIMALKLARGEIHETGAHPCIGFISLDEYLQRLEPLDIQWRTVVST